MRHLMLLLVPFAALGCAAPCPTATESLNQSLWHVFNKPTEILTPPLADGYPGWTSPASGWHDMIITWGSSSDQSPVTVNMDGQVLTGRGIWDPDECGNFTLTFNGEYAGDDGTEHDLVVTGDMWTWDGHLEGIWDLREVWTGFNGKKDEDSWVVQVIGAL